MNIIPDEFENRPFGDDFFNRKVVADNLTNLILNNEKSLVISLNGAWGEGKTYFVNNWVAFLKERAKKQDSNIIPILYNAFENDFSDEVFITLAASIERELEKYYGEIWLKEERAKKLKEQGKELAKDLVLLTSTTLIETVIGVNVSGFFKKRIESAQRFDKEANKALVDQKFDKYLKLEKTIKAYRDRLKDALEFKGDNKILFIIDELDRCRPDFALQVIEKIKHLFNVPNVHFVLAVNKSQLLSSIKHAYGVSEKDSKVYWQKFFHLETSLPSVKNLSVIGDHNSSIKAFVLNRIKAHNLPNQIIDSEKISWLLRFVNGNGKIELVPRSIERIFQYYTVIASANELIFMERYWRVIFLLILMRLEAPVYYDDIRRRKGKIIGGIFASNGPLRNKSTISLPSFLENLLKRYLLMEDYTGENSDKVNLVNFDQIIEKIELYDIPHTSTKKRKN